MPRLLIMGLLFATVCGECSLSQTSVLQTDPRAVSGGSTPTCGLLCEAKAKITLTALPGPNGFLEHKFFSVSYTVRNTYVQALTGVMHISFNGKPATNLEWIGGGTPALSTFTLQPQQDANGTVFILDPASGISSVEATFDSPVSCQVQRVGELPSCTSTNYANTFAGVQIAPDKDLDGLSDDTEDALLKTYAPLLLFTKDHGKQEEYAPIDVVDFTRSSSLVSKDDQVASLPKEALQTPSIILNPTNAGNLGQILQFQVDSNGVSLLPRKIYVSPSESAKHGAAWSSVLARRNVGLYGHVVPLTVAEVPDKALHVSLASKLCNGDILCAKRLYKVEYWQFFGYSHDFEVTAGDTIAELTAEALAQPFVPVPLVPIDLKELAADVIDHGGDWCTVQLYIDADESNADKAMLAVYHYAHGLQFGFDLTQNSVVSGPIPSSTDYNPSGYEIKQFQGINAGKSVKLPFQNAAQNPTFANAQNNVAQFARSDSASPYIHPVVYVEWGGHEFWPSSAWSFAFASKHSGNGYSYFADSVPNIGEIGAPRGGIAAPLVTGFAGFWGFYGWENHNKPPQGPPLHAQWFWLNNGQIPLNVRPNDPPF